MHIFDIHGDIWTDAAVHRSKGEKNIVRDRHLKRFQEGGMTGGVFIAWVDPPFDKEGGRERFWEIVRAMSAELWENRDLLEVVETASAFDKAVATGKLGVVPGVEGLSAVEDSEDWIYVLDRLGFKLASLTWNEQNALATGVRGDENRGLTEAGKKMLAKMEEVGMLLDVSHLNEKSFWDVVEHSRKPFIASHSNVQAIRRVPRNLSDAQIRAIGEKDGLIGMNAFHEFVHEDPEKRTVDTLVDHIAYIAERIGAKRVGLGFDFFEYVDAGAVSTFATEAYVGTKGLEDISHAKTLIHKLRERGFSEDEVEGIAWKNFFRVLESVRK
ncbi:MAG: dipeptidase [Peptoniphilaceae bacterium]|jgi:membrane dipeptidase